MNRLVVGNSVSDRVELVYSAVDDIASLRPQARESEPQGSRPECCLVALCEQELPEPKVQLRNHPTSRVGLPSLSNPTTGNSNVLVGRVG